jgi:hypothetical protein
MEIIIRGKHEYSYLYKRIEKKFWIVKHFPIFAIPNEKCRVGQGVKTPPFHGGITGSNPVRGTKKRTSEKRSFFILPIYFPHLNFSLAAISCHVAYSQQHLVLLFQHCFFPGKMQ